MGKSNKNGSKTNVFKVAGAKSLKKMKAKPVKLGLKNIKQKVQDIDKQFLEINKSPKPNTSVAKSEVKIQKKIDKKVTQEEIVKTAEEIVKLDL